MHDSGGRPVVDWRELRYWKIPESALPPGTLVQFRQPSEWDQHRNLIFAIAVLIILLVTIIVYLLQQRGQRRKMEQRLVAGSNEVIRYGFELSETEERFRLMADSASVLLWVAEASERRTFFNRAWLEFTGKSLDLEVNDGWMAGVHPDDLERCRAIYSGARDAHLNFELEYRLLRKDGKYRSIVEVAAPRFTANGVFSGYIGSCTDVTERKLIEKSLEELSGRLIASQEEERTRIGRDLHDDFSQRLALLGIGLGRLWKRRPASEEDERLVVRELLDRIQEITSDIHRLSHQLHSSKLEHLGLAPALKGLCSEIGEKYDIQVEFTEIGPSAEIPKDVELCLFRVAQEGLSNMAKYSEAKRAELELGAGSEGMWLRIADHGVGFDPAQEKPNAGIGLISMRERLRLVGGSFSVTSAQMAGTEIVARVPLAKSRKEINARSHSASQ